MSKKTINSSELEAMEKYNSLWKSHGKFLEKKKGFEETLIKSFSNNKAIPWDLALAIKDSLDKGIYESVAKLASSIRMSESKVRRLIKVLELEEEIIKDLMANRSTDDIEALYEIQKIKNNKKEQIKVYFDFINEKLDLVGLKELNKKAKRSLYPSASLRPKHNTVTFQIDTNLLTKRETTALYDELKAIMNKYVIWT